MFTSHLWVFDPEMPCFGQLWCIQMCRGLQGSSAGRVCQKMCKWRGFLQMLCKVCEHPFLCFWPGFQTVSQHLKYGLGGEGTLNPPPPKPTAYFFSDSQVTRLCYSKYFEFCFRFQNIIIRNTMFWKINKEVCQYSCPNGIYCTIFSGGTKWIVINVGFAAPC